ncbi:MAG: HNH endonuclease [Oscillospiraceae bacterium]|nr:HNH endonuclease [Oscillospiraceae bacterium]
MNIVVNILNKYIGIVDFETMQLLSLINVDFGLIRYITELLQYYTISKNRSGYLQIENRWEGTTLLHRIVLEYYSQFDDKLKDALSNADYEVNHRNKNVWDNRIGNLEIVTKKGNELHKQGKEYSNETIISSHELIKIRNKARKTGKGYTKQFKEDFIYMEERANASNKLLFGSSINSYNDILDYLYFIFNGTKLKTHINTHILTDSKNIQDIKSFLMLEQIIKQSIYELYLKNSNKVGTIINVLMFKGSDIAQFNYDIKSYIKQYNLYKGKALVGYYKHLIFALLYDEETSLKYLQPLKELLIEVNAYNPLYVSNYKDYFNQQHDINKHNILEDFLFLVDRSLLFTYYKNQLCVTVSMQSIFFQNRKISYRKTLRVLYYLGLLQRVAPSKAKLHFTAQLSGGFLKQPTSLIIPPPTKDLFIKANELAKEYKTEFAANSKITSFTTHKNLGQEASDKIYKNKRTKPIIQRSLFTEQDIYDLLSTTLLEHINTYGFITRNTLLGALRKLNEQRKAQGLPYVDIADGTITFISTLFNNVLETKEFLKQHNLKYITHLNTRTINKIKKHQLKNNVDDTFALAPSKSALILKKLYLPKR